MLNWVEEEKQYIDKKVDEYLEEQSKMPLGFMISQKTLCKNIKKIKKEATDKYRFEKLMKYRREIETERQRINKVIEDINNKFNEYLKTIKCNVDKNIKPFKLEAKEYKRLDIKEFVATEIVRISCEPFQIAFIQEKID